MEKTFEFDITRNTDIVFKPKKIKLTPLNKTSTGRIFKVELIEEFASGSNTQCKTQEIPDSLNIEACFEGGYDLDNGEPIINFTELQRVFDNFGLNLT